MNESLLAGYKCMGYSQVSDQYVQHSVGKTLSDPAVLINLTYFIALDIFHRLSFWLAWDWSEETPKKMVQYPQNLIVKAARYTMMMM